MIKSCQGCNKSFHTSPCRIKGGKGKFCSKKCFFMIGAFTPEHRRNISDALKGKKIPLEVREKISKNHSRHNLGKPMSVEAKTKVRLAKLGKSAPWMIGNKYGKGNKSLTGRIGENSNNWKGGISVGENKINYRRKMVLERRARKYNALGSHTLGGWLALKAKYDFMCLCCKKIEPEITLSEDHIIPISRGGADDISNIQPLCRSCNSRKNIKTFDYRKLLV